MAILNPKYSRLEWDIDTVLLTTVEEHQQLQELIASEVVADASDDTYTIEEERMGVKTTERSRSTIHLSYPRPDELARFAHIVHCVLRCSNIPERQEFAVTSRVTLVYSQDSGESAYVYLAQKLRPAAPMLTSGELYGMTTQLVFVRNEQSFSAIQLEPRFRDTSTHAVFINYSVQERGQAIPDEDHTLASLKETWMEVVEIAKRVDARG